VLSFRSVLLAGGAVFAVHLFLSQAGLAGRTVGALAAANPAWLGLAALCCVGTYFAAGLAQLGAASMRVAYVEAAMVQVASSFANKVTPASLGGAAVNVRYLQRVGLARNDAYAAVALNTAAGAVLHVTALVVAGICLGRGGFGIFNLPTTSHLVLGSAVVAVIAVAVFSSPIGQRRLVPPLRLGAAAVVATLRQPRKAVELFGGSAAITTLYAFALWASLQATHGGVSIGSVGAVYLGSAAVTAVAPTPGGMGAMEAALVAGFTGLGAAAGPALAGVLAFRLVTFWLPILPGWVVFRRLVQEGVL
jgi:undecaprenyl-diphosphatase